MCIKNYEDKTLTYIVDEQYRILYFNEAMQEKFPDLQLQQCCYQALNLENAPCKNCPLHTQNNNGVVYYNKVMNQWITVHSCHLNRPQEGPCYLLMCENVSPDNKNLFYNLTNLSTYDELFEINLTEDTYHTLYHASDSYNILRKQGCLSTMLDRIEIGVVHPEDLLAHHDFWNPATLSKRIRESNQNAIIEALFRLKKKDGSWAFTRHIIVPLKVENNQIKALCFLIDVHSQTIRERSLQKIPTEEKNRLTGLLNADAFLEKADKFIQDYKETPLCMLALDIEHFKLFNDWYGWNQGDEYLKSVAGYLANMEKNYPCLVGYMSGDNFAAVIPYDMNIISELMETIQNYVIENGHEVGFFPLCGYYVVENQKVSSSLMYDRAAIALSKIRGSYYTRINKYESNMVQEMEDELFLLSDIQRGLAEKEFLFYVQPKCHMSTGRIVGAESLVRWKHRTKGLVPPGVFIPVLEKNGFISSLDCYVWEEVCKWQRSWIDRGNRPLPISVNVSQIDILSLNVVDFFTKLIEKYNLDPSLIEIEITESAYAKKFDNISDMVEQLHQAGFQVSMDDFGSGYSSLNMLRNLNVDILKIDMKFLQMDKENSDRGYGILESIVNMARQMNMPIIVEGVETDTQIKYLRDMGCRYAQGYFFYKPMPVDDYEALLSDKNNISTRGIYAKKVEQIHTREFLDINLFSDTMLNNILGPAAFYDLHNGNISLLRVNEQYYKLTGIDDLDKQLEYDPLVHVHEFDKPLIYQAIEEAHNNPVSGSECLLRYIKDDGTQLWLSFRLFFMRKQDDHEYFYGSVKDVTTFRS